MFKVKLETSSKDCKLLKIFPQAILKHRQICKGVRGVKVVVSVKTPNGEKIEVIDEHPCEIAMCILNSGAIVTSSEVFGDRTSWTAICSNYEIFKEIMSGLERLNIDFEVIYKATLAEKEERDEITHNEYRLLKLAYERGFFDSPKRIKLDELAKLEGISKSTASDTLRRALKKVLSRFFEF
ncbi:MAG: helix-turn-helix domain-containing protein [Archaeoglobus sp.]|nr:helix-turn-helix domain-containing protein [Archaeoglobus sp.]